MIRQHHMGQKHLKLQSGLFRGFFLLSAAILILFGIFFYTYVSGILIRNEMNTLTSQNSHFETQVDNVLKDLDDASANINYSNLMKDKLDASFHLNITESSLPGLVDLFVTINGTDIKADQINLYDFSGNVVKVGILTGTSSVDPKSLTWMEETKKQNGIKLISDPYYTDAYSKTIRSPEWFISIYRTCSNQYGRKVGAIETVKRCKTVFKSIRSYSKRTATPASVYIFDTKGHLIYPYDLEEEDIKSYQFYYDGLSLIGDNGFLKNPETGKREHLAYDVSAYSGFTFITVQPESVILAPVNHLLYILFGVMLVFTAAIVAASYSLSRTMVKPIKHLKHRIQRLEVDTLGDEPKDTYNPNYDELAELYAAFEHMNTKLKISMDELIDTRAQEVRSRTLALQSQTNPHFYYNTLSSIIILAENGQISEVSTLCRNLSKIMRYITDSTSMIVSLRDEIDYVKKYLYCMKVRYQESLSYSIDIDESLYTQQIPKLLIQPIVENALKYGTDCLPPWQLSIQSQISENGWLIHITDSGNGFSEESLHKIRQQVKDTEKHIGMPDLSINGLGLVNVYVRWKLYIKDLATFEVGNTKEGHGIVSIGKKNQSGDEQT